MDEDLKQYEAILLSGCATLGSAHLGFLLSLQHHKRIRFLKVVSGTSIGSIIGFLFVLGIPLRDILLEYRTKQFLDLLSPASKEDVMQKVGLATVDYIIAHIVDIMQTHHIDPHITFETVQNERKLALIVTATKEVDTPELFVPTFFSPKTSPHMRVLDAIKMSISIPLLFITPTYEGATYYDGAITCNLPYDHIESEFGIAKQVMIGHSPTVQRHFSTIEPSIGRLLTRLIDYVSRVMSTINDRRTVETHLGVGATIDLMTTPEYIDYYFHQAIKSTNHFIKQKQHSEHVKHTLQV